MKYISLAFLFFGCSSISDDFQPDPKPGEVWEYHHITDNPFDGGGIYQMTIIDVQNGYVLYDSKVLGRHSSTMHYFKIETHRISAKK